MEWFFAGILFLLFLVAVVLWWRERRYLKKKISEVMSESVWHEIEEERAENLDKRRKFREALRRAQGRKTG